MVPQIGYKSSYVHLFKSVQLQSAVAAVAHVEMSMCRWVQAVTRAHRTLKCTRYQPGLRGGKRLPHTEMYTLATWCKK